MMSTKFNNIIKSKNPVLVDFYADWCLPCKQVPPILKEVKNAIKERVRIVKVNVDKNPLIATKYQIRNLPTIMIFKDGKEIWTGTGIQDVEEIKSILMQELGDRD